MHQEQQPNSVNISGNIPTITHSRCVIRRFKQGDINNLALQDSQLYLMPLIKTPEYQSILENSVHSFSAVIDDRVIGCAGFVEMHKYRAVAWALLSQHVGVHMVRITNEIKEVLNMVSKITDWRRVEAHVLSTIGISESEAKAERWLKMMNFVYEGTLKCYDSTGYDVKMYGRIY